MIFRQLFEPGCSGYTYLLACESSLQALLIDPVIETVERDIAFLRALGLTLSCTLETHIHADHVTGAGRLRELTGSKIAVPSRSAACYVDIGISEEEPISLGSLVVQPLYTPGHTADHHSYVLRSGGQGRVFTGDALLIDGCGRTDFQEGDAPTLYQSVHEKIFSLPDDTLVYPGHDYQQRRVSNVAQEKARNPRLGGERSLDEFVAIMRDLKLPRPAKMDVAVPANRMCGEFQPA